MTLIKADTNLKAGTVPLVISKLLIDGATSNTIYQKRCEDQTNMDPNFPYEYVSNRHKSKYRGWWVGGVST